MTAPALFAILWAASLVLPFAIGWRFGARAGAVAGALLIGAWMAVLFSGWHWVGKLVQEPDAAAAARAIRAMGWVSAAFVPVVVANAVYFVMRRREIG